MAIKGLGYVKTSWAFEERPVASSKLNTWDDRMEAALELMYVLLGQAWGGRDGVVREAAEEGLKAVATASPGMSVAVKPGYALISGYPFRLATETETVDVAAPVTNDRIDLVQASLETWSVTVKPGTEAGSPVMPTADADHIALAGLYLRPGMVSIKNSDDAVNGYVVDARVFL